MFKSIRWKFITVYFLLVFMAMLIVGVFIIQQFKEYHLNVVSDNLTKLAQDGLLKSIDNFEDLDAHKEEIQKDIDTWSKGLQEEIFIINHDFQIIATSNNNLANRNAVEVLDDSLLTDGRNGQVREKDIIIKSRGITAKNMIFPIGKPVRGMLYLRADLSTIYETLDRSKLILTKATLLALMITILLGFFIAKSVTEPIIDVTAKAAKMAKGDFDQKVEVKSDDEIGHLAEMFNYLREKLKTTLSEISSEKSKLETILNYMADGLIAVDNTGRIIHANPSAMKMLNLSYDKIQHQYYDDIIGKLNKKLTIAYIKENNLDWMGSGIIGLNGSIFHASYAPFKDEKEKKAGIVMVLQDITERQKLDNMRKEFVANVSHELKTPLTSIKSYTETLLEGALEDRELLENFLKVINSEVDRMTRLVRDLLQLSSLDYKKTQWNKQECDLVKVIENLLLKVSMTAKSKHQRISFFTKEENMIGYMDCDKIEQVILNIFSNAIKYTPEKGEIKIILNREKNDGMIYIQDNGIGIPAEDVPRLFERFYRVDKARSRELGGTGLGLSIAKQIIEAHQGTITIQSQHGVGTEVIIKIPLEEKAM
jgi:two-component system sensor histidine kinase VicK